MREMKMFVCILLFLCICFKTAVLNHECVMTSDIAKNDQNLNPKFLPSS